MPRIPHSPADLEALLRSRGEALNPSSEAKDRIKTRLLQRMAALPESETMRAESLLHSARKSLEPSSGLSATLWQRIQGSLHPVSTRTFWENLREVLLPSADTSRSVWARIAAQLDTQHKPAAGFHPLKWAAAFAVVALIIRVSPMLVLAPQTIADSPVTANRTRGVASVLVGGLWQPIETELRLQKASQLSTQEGELTVVLHDDAVIRLAPWTTITLNDVSDRPAESGDDATITLEGGQVWVMGFVPKPVRGITVATAQGWVTIQEGSTSIEQRSRDVVTVRSWDRSATVTRRGIAISLLAAEELALGSSAPLMPQKIDSNLFDDAWVSGNIARDAVHQKEMAQMQRERRAARAGILPDSRLYPVKRLAETMDVLLTFGSEARTRKALGHANTRLSEAAALLSGSGGVHTSEAHAQAEIALKEFHDAVLAVASGSGDTIVSDLLENELVATAVSDTSAALPSDDEYLLKQAVRETIASLPDSVEKPDTAAAAVLDEVALAKRQAGEGDLTLAQAKLDEVRETLNDETGTSALLTPEALEEVQATIAAVESTVEENRPDRLPDAEAALTRRAEPLMPSLPTFQPLTDEEVEQKVQEIRGQIYVFELKRSQMNELREQIRSLDHHPDKGRILRRLYKVLPSNGLAQEVRRQIAGLDELNRAIQQEMQESSSSAEAGTCVEGC